MRIEEFLQKLTRIRSDIEKDGEPIMERAAISARALIERRIKEEGIGKYSENKKTPAFRFYGKGTNKSKEAAFIKQKSKKVDGEPQYTNWKEFRESQGLQTSHIDLTYTGRMFNNLKVTNVGKLGQLKFVATLSNDQELEAKKMEWNTERYGEFLKTNDKEEEMLTRVIDGELQRIINKNL
jgi:hypothetical protein